MSGGQINTSSCNPPFIQVEAERGAGFTQDTISWCLDGCCAPCPAQDLLFPDAWEMGFHVVDIINIVSLVLSLFSLLAYTVLPGRLTARNKYIVALTFSLAALHATSAYTLIDYRSLTCVSEYQWANQHNSSKCLVQGAQLMWSILAVVIWLGLRVLVNHLQIVRNFTLSPKAEMILTQLIGWGIPTIFTTVALAIGQIRFELGHMCQPSVIDGLGLLWIPLMVFAAPIAILQIWTIVKIMSAMRVARAGERSPSGVKRPIIEYRRAGIVDVLSIKWRSMFLTFFILFIALYYGINNILVFKYIGHYQDQVFNLIRWILCFEDGRNQDTCLDLAVKVIPLWRVLSADAFRSILGIIVFIMEASRLTYWQAWAVFFAKLRSHSVRGGIGQHNVQERDTSMNKEMNEYNYETSTYTAPVTETHEQVVDGLRVRAVQDVHGKTSYIIEVDDSDTNNFW